MRRPTRCAPRVLPDLRFDVASTVVRRRAPRTRHAWLAHARAALRQLATSTRRCTSHRRYVLDGSQAFACELLRAERLRKFLFFSRNYLLVSYMRIRY
eukprot:4272303-Pleurochrysis_carterae.AAC.4